ncbi:MAG: PAS domain-containing protein [Dehalococcoidia bacterium]|nr:PAS domain-containing protein [Dehalococcoidia bacterium]
MTQIGSLPYVAPPAIAAVIGLAIIAVVMKWAPPSPSRRPFILMVTGLVAWGATIFGMRINTDIATALIWDQLAAPAIVVMFLGFYHFSLVYTKTSGQRHALAVGYALVVVFLMSTPTGLIVKGLRVEDYGYAPISGVLAIPAVITSVMLLFAGVRTLVRRYRMTSSYEERNRLLYLIAGASLSALGSVLDIVTNLPPVGIWTNILFCGISAVALLGYRLLDIPEVARHTITYLVLGVMVALPYAAVLLALQTLVGDRLQTTWGYAASILILAILLRPLYGAAQNLVDRLFFRDRYDALRALEQFAHDAHSVVDLHLLSSKLTSLVTEALHATSTCLFLPAENERVFELFHYDGPGEPPEHRTLAANSALIRWLREHPQLLYLRNLDIEPRLQSLSLKERSLLEALNARILVPITSRTGQISGLLVLGEKQSHGDYSAQDGQFVQTIGRQLALSLENARLFSDSRRVRADLEGWLDGMSDHVVIIGPDRRIRFMNRSAKDNLGTSIGAPCWTMYGSGKLCAECDAAAAWRDRKGSARFSRTIRNRQYDVVAAPLRDPGGELSLISVSRDVTERYQFEERLRRSEDELRQLAAHIESVREEERTGIARELHDELGQSLTALKMDISWISRHLCDGRPDITAKLSSMISLTEFTIETVQRISSELRPGILDDLGLSSAIEWLAIGFQERSGIACNVDLDEELEMSGNPATVLFRICQESLTNAARHSEAQRITITLRKVDTSAVLTVSDNGRGITEAEISRSDSLGIIGMRERVRALGGHIEISGAQGKGTSVRVSLPLM